MPDLGERSGIWKRYIAGALVCIIAAAAATSVSGFNQVDKIVGAFGGHLDLGDELAQAPPGDPQTILLIGSDRRSRSSRDAQLGSGVRSDTMILMRLDPKKEAIALLSLPRDLKVRIPGHGVDKLNIAYAEGGTKLALRTIKEFTGLRVNHVINVDFGGFKGAVDAINCVYTDVDRRYFNDNSGADQYATINIDPGYQKLCGQDALDYVRYRHTDNDIVRAARQQDFLRQAKSQVGVGKLIEDQEKLIKVVSRYTRSDIKGRKQVLSLLKLAIGSAGHPIREIHFPAQIGESYVTARQSSVKKVTRKFLGVESSSGPRGPAQPREPRKKRSKRKPSGSSKLVSVTPLGKQQALTIAGQARGYQIYYPRLVVPGTTFSQNSPRVYKICGPNRGRCYQSYRIVLTRDLIGEYYGLQGTRWMDPPILQDPSEKREYRGRDFELFYDGDRLRLVAWREKEAVYWVSNTLLQTLSERQMLDIARAAAPL